MQKKLHPEPPETVFKLLVVCSSNILNKSLFHWQVDNEITHRGSVESGPRRAAGLSRGWRDERWRIV